jgi:hypothetical protein
LLGGFIFGDVVEYVLGIHIAVLLGEEGGRAAHGHDDYPEALDFHDINKFRGCKINTFRAVGQW